MSATTTNTTDSPRSGPARLQGRVALISGSSTGLGSAVAHTYSLEGATIFCIDISPSPRNAINPTTGKAGDISSRSSEPGTHELIRRKGGEASFHKCDVTKAREVEFAVRACVQKYGRVDVLVCCAGVSVESAHARVLRCHETSEEDYDRTMNVNAKGVFLCNKYALKQMLEQEIKFEGGRGWIVNVSSVQGLVPYKGTVSYCASKGGVVMMSKQIALDYAQDGVRCNCVCPGFLETGMTVNLTAEGNEEVLSGVKERQPLGQGLGKVEDVARMCVVLASDDIRWMTGQPVVIDGGYMLG